MAAYAPVPVFDPPTDPYAPARESPRLNAHQYPPSAHNNDSLAYLDDPTAAAPNPRFLQEGYNRDSLASRASSYTVGSVGEDRGLVAGAVTPAGYGAGGLGATGSYSDHPQQYDSGYNPAAYVYEPPKKRRGWLLPLIVALVLLVVLGVGLGVYFGVVKPNQSASVKGGSNGTSTSGGPRPTGTGTPTANVLLTGGDGSQVTMEDGNSKFTYNNSFGGYWYYDHKNPLAGPAGVANSWTPPSNESWPWGVNKQHGVNLGGWLVLEPFISPAMFEPYAPDAIDEYTLTQRMAADTARGGLQTIMEAHYQTFITEQDFANIAAAGLTWIRLPIGFWAIQKFDDEPFLEGVAWKYFVKAVVWARKYGLRINIDLHAVPGSQNGWNHSGKVGDVNWMMGAMGVANAQRALDIIRIITEFICQPEVTNVVPMFGIMNEPRGNVIGPQALYDFNYQVYNVIRTISGPGRGPVISFHTGFLGNEGWNTFIPRADRIALDRHPYLIFGDRQSNDPPLSFAASVCTEWSTWTNTTSQEFGLNSAGEWSAAINDCGLWVNALGVGADFDQQFGAGACDTWNNWETWTTERKTEMSTFVAANMDALKDWFFWTWKIGPSTQFANKVVTPMWSYSLGWENGWIPKDPRTAAGTCQTLGYAQNTPFDGNFQTWQVTGQGGAVPAASDTYPWPPTQLIDVADASLAPTYVPTGPTPTIVAADFDIPQQLQTFVPKRLEGGMYVPIPGCTYPGTYQGVGAALPPPCAAAPGAGGGSTTPPVAGGVTTSAPPVADVTTTDPAPDAVPTEVAPA